MLLKKIYAYYNIFGRKLIGGNETIFLTDIKISQCFQGYKRYLKVLQTKADDVAPRSRDNALTARSPSAKRTQHMRFVVCSAGFRFVRAYRPDKIPNRIIQSQSGGNSTGRHIRHHLLAHMYGQSAPSCQPNFCNKLECGADYSPSTKAQV